MLTLNSGLIDKSGKILECKYYELEKICIDIVNNYCKESKENREQFENFAKNYKTFRPYFDFVVCVLEYKVLNPEMEENTILVGKNNHMYIYKNDEDLSLKKAFCYDLSDDITLNIYPMTLDSSIFGDYLIDGNCNHILPKDMYGHVHLFRQILNMMLISNEEICKDYLNYNLDVGNFVQRYYPLLRFQTNRMGNMILVKSFHRNDNLTLSQQNFLSDLIDNRYTYPSFLYNLCEEDNFTSKDLSATFMYEQNKSKIKN